MKPTIVILSLLCLFGCQNHSDSVQSKFKTILLLSEGEVETIPDMATFSIDLNCLDASVKMAKKCLVDKSNELNSKLLSFGIHKNDITTTAVDMNKSYTWSNDSRVFEGYNSSTSVHITVRNLDKLDEIYSELLENSNLIIGQLHYEHSETDSLKNEAYLKALESASVLADKLLANLPESRKEVLKIGNVQFSASTPELIHTANSESNEMATKRKSVAVSKGTMKVNANLYVEYLIN